eukprot:m.334971 g.334971  ORF g.334971 m.334971 type:complete len:260 (-) comp17483_c0_seq1:42-821(-)
MDCLLKFTSFISNSDFSEQLSMTLADKERNLLKRDDDDWLDCLFEPSTSHTSYRQSRQTGKENNNYKNMSDFEEGYSWSDAAWSDVSDDVVITRAPKSSTSSSESSTRLLERKQMYDYKRCERPLSDDDLNSENQVVFAYAWGTANEYKEYDEDLAVKKGQQPLKEHNHNILREDLKEYLTRSFSEDSVFQEYNSEPSFTTEKENLNPSSTTTKATKTKTLQRRRSSVTRVAKRWRISYEEAYELCMSYEDSCSSATLG